MYVNMLAVHISRMLLNAKGSIVKSPVTRPQATDLYSSTAIVNHGMRFLNILSDIQTDYYINGS